MSTQQPHRDHLALLWQRILSRSERRDELFDSYASRLLDRHAEDRLPHPGFVGKDYIIGGLLFLGMNPGTGGDGQAADELPHYERLRQLMVAEPEQRLTAFERLIEYDTDWYPRIRIMQTIVSPLLASAGLTYSCIAYLNVLKWRTAKSSGLSPLYRISLKAHTLEQLNELEPGVIAVLGKGVANALQELPEFQDTYGSRCVTIPRLRGDYGLPVDGLAAIERIVQLLRNRKASA